MVVVESRPADSTRTQLLEAARTINLLQGQLRASREVKPASNAEPIAVVGLSLRMPGGATGPRSWWPLLHDGVDATSPFPAERADAAGYHHPDPEHPGTTHVIRGGFLGRVDGFDPAVFGISPREATGMDPQQRMALELCWEALEDAAIAPDQLTDSATGVFIGVSTSDYVRMRQRIGDMRDIDAYQLIGEPSFIAGRISYTLGLQGPSCVVDTACSSSLVALHQAVRSLRLGESDVALAGGVNLLLDPYGFVLMSKFRALAADGRCKTFDDSADGYARGEGGGVVTLQRLSDAIADRRVIRGVIAGTAVNHDGRSSGMTVPNPESQQKVMRGALLDAGLSPLDIDYVEAHGTGTALGDPIELRAIHAVYGQGRPARSPVVVGSVKSNIGHLEPAAGIAGLAKVLLSLEHGQIPPNLHLHSGNSRVDWDRLAVTVPTSVRDWARSQRSRLAAISSFGASGTNAHTIVGEAPRPSERAQLPDRPEVMVLSARTHSALRTMAQRYDDHLATSPQAPVADICWTTQTGRARLEHGLSVVGSTPAALSTGLRDYLAGTRNPAVTSTVRGAYHQLRSVWLCTGQGAQYPGMAKDLLAIPAFSAAARECIELFDQHLDLPLAEVIWGSRSDRLGDTAFTQPALFTIEYAMAELLSSSGLRPSVLIGHSIGEIVAATVAGVLTLAGATRLVAARGRLMSALPPGGAMLAVSASEATLAEVIGELPDRIALAAVNSPSDLVLSGAAEQLSALARTLAAARIQVTPLTVSHAFHSPLLEPMLDEFRRELSGLRMKEPGTALISSLTGQWWDERCGTPEYWVDQARGTVRFAAGMQTLAADGIGVFIELGPHPVLTGLGQRCLPPDAADSPLWTAPLRRGGDDRAGTMGALGQLHLRGLPVDWRAAHGDVTVNRAALPTYPWERERFWFRTSGPRAAGGPSVDGLGQLLGSATPTWQDSIDAPVAAGDRLGWVVSRAVRAAGRAGLLVGGRVELGAVELHAAPAEAADYPHLIQTSVESEGTAGRVLIRAASAEQAAAGAQWHLVARVEVGAPSGSEPGPGPLRPDATVTPVELNREPAGDPAAACAVILRACQQAAAGSGEVRSAQVRSGEVRSGEALSHLDRMHAGALHSVSAVAIQVSAVAIQVSAVAMQVPAVALQPGAVAPAMDCLLLDHAGSVIGHLTGLRPAVTPPAPRAPWYPQDQLVLVNAWQELSPADEPRLGSGPVLLVGGPQALAGALAGELTARGAVVEVTGLATLLSRIDTDAPAADGRIVLLDAARLPAAGATTAAVLGDRALPFEQQVLRLVRWLAAHPESGNRLSIVTRGAVRAADEQQMTCPAGSPLWGLGRVLALEHAAAWGGLVDVDPGVDVEDAALCLVAAPTIALALLTAGIDDQQAQRGARRLGARVRRGTIAAAPERRPLLSAPGTVLITGGLGGIGLALAGWCARRGVARLVLTSRSPEPRQDCEDAAADRWVAVRNLRAQGIDLRVEAVDGTDAAATAGLVHRLAQDSELPLRGVIHAAGVSEPQFVVDADDEAYRRVWAPKVLGAWALHEATRGLDLDMFVLFSSVAASWGSQHLASYAAGNAFLDALAETRSCEGLPVTTVAWGPWELPSNLFGQDVVDFLQSVGLRQLAADQCLHLLGRAVASGRAHQIVCAADWSRYRPVMEARIPRPILHDIDVAQTEQDGAPAAGLAVLLAAGERGGIAVQTEVMTGLVGGIAAAALGVPAGSIGAATDVFALGLDSIMVLEVVSGCRRQFGLTVPPSALFERSTLGEWASHLVGMLEDPVAGGGSKRSEANPELVENLQSRSVLPADIQAGVTGRSGLGQRVLLTGATGFVGAYLLRELLEQDGARTVHCLVRGPDTGTALQRILGNAARYFAADKLDADRIRIVLGDLAAPGLGLAEQVRARLLAGIDSIVHDAARVNFAHTYEQLAPANIDGTVELVRIAAATGVPLHHVSTYGIWGLPTDRDRVYEDDPIHTSGRLVTGYVQTKWGAEHVVHQAAQRGIPTAVYRLGRVLGDSVTGAALTTHFTCRVIKSCIQLGAVPDLDITIEMTPVDYVARALVAIAASAPAGGKAYHLVNPVHMPFRELAQTIRERGWDVELTSPEEWWRRLLDAQGRQPNDLHSVMPTVQEMIVGGERAVDYDTAGAVAALAGTGISCPPLDRALLDRYFDYFLATGYLTH